MIETMPSVEPSSELGRAYARKEQLRRNASAMQQELANLAGAQAESLRAFRLAVSRDRDSQGFVTPIAERTQRIEAIEAQLRPLLADLRAAEERFAGLYRQYQQAHTAIEALRLLAG